MTAACSRLNSLFDTFSVRRKRGAGPSPSGSRIAGLVEQRARLRRDRAETCRRPASNAQDDGRQQADGRRREAAPQVVDDRLAVDGVGERLPHAHVLQHRVAQVEADVLIVDAGRLSSICSRGSSLELMHDVGARSLTTMSIVPLRSSSPRMMSSGTTFSTRPSLRGAPAEVVVEGRELDAVVDGVAHEPVRARCRSGWSRSSGPAPSGTIGMHAG